MVFFVSSFLGASFPPQPSQIPRFLGFLGGKLYPSNVISATLKLDPQEMHTLLPNSFLIITSSCCFKFTTKSYWKLERSIISACSMRLGYPSSRNPLEVSDSLILAAKIAHTMPSFINFPLYMLSKTAWKNGLLFVALMRLISSPTVKLVIAKSLANLPNPYIAPNVPLPAPGAPIIIIRFNITFIITPLKTKEKAENFN
jgi:hypothetical protein